MWQQYGSAVTSLITVYQKKAIEHPAHKKVTPRGPEQASIMRRVGSENVLHNQTENVQCLNKGIYLKHR